MRNEQTIPQKNLVHYRLNHGMTQADMAKKLNIQSQQMYEYYENKRLTTGKALRFSEQLGFNLFDGTTKMQKDLAGAVIPGIKNDNLDFRRIEAAIKVLIHRLAKYEAKAIEKPVADCKKEIEDDIQLVLG